MSPTLLLSLVLAHPSQDAEPHVTYKTVAVPLSRALDEVSKATGLKLKAAPQTENDTVVLSLKDVPAAEFKARLAKAVVGTWTKSDDGTELLSADVVARGALSRAATQKRTDELTKALKKLQEQLGASKSDPEAAPAAQMIGGFGGSDAGTKLIAQLSLGLRATDLAAVGSGGRVVYSTQPNSMQKPLGAGGLQKAVEEFVKAHNEQVQAMQGAQESADPAMQQQIDQAKSLFGDMMKTPARIDAPPTKLLLVAERGGMFGFFNDAIELHLVAFDAKGNAQATSTYPLNSDFMGMVAARLPGQETKPKEAPPKDPKLDKPIELSPVAKELKGYLNFGAAATGPKKPSPELLERILRPDLFDPLSFETSESLLALSAAESTNLVAVLPDDEMDFRRMASLGGGSSTLASFKEGLATNENLVMEDKDGWNTVRAIDPEGSKANKVDRKALAKFLAAAQNSVVPSLDSLATYATVNPPVMETPVIMPHIMMVAPNAMSLGTRGVQDWKMLRLYGLLGASERDTLRQGKPLPFSSVGLKGQAILRQMVYGAGSKLQVGPEKESKLGGMFAGMSMGMGTNISSYREEPTELLPTGLPAGGAISLTLKPSHFVLAADGKAGFAAMFGAMGPSEYAMLKFFSEEPKMAAMGSMMPKLDKLKVGERDTLDFRLLLATDVTQKHTLLDQRIAKDAATVGLDGLPKDFLAEVDAQMKLYKEGLSPFLSMPGMLGDRGVPPR